MNKIFILLLTAWVVELYFMSFGNQTISIPMMRSMYEVKIAEFVKVLSIITGVGFLCFLYFGLKYTSNTFWGLLMIGAALAASLLGWKHVFGIHSGTWGGSVLLSIVLTVVILAFAINKCDIDMDPLNGEE